MSTPRFLADEDLRLDIVRAVRRLEPSAEFRTVVGCGLSGASDADVLDYASAEDLIVVSHDVNTMKGLAESRLAQGIEIAGLLLAPQGRGTRAVAESLVLIWSASQHVEWRDRVVYLPL